MDAPDTGLIQADAIDRAALLVNHYLSEAARIVGTHSVSKAVRNAEALRDWCQQSGIDMDNCVAFKMERAGIRAEVVLVREGETYRVVRCNNVKQMASERPLS